MHTEQWLQVQEIKVENTISCNSPILRISLMSKQSLLFIVNVLFINSHKVNLRTVLFNKLYQPAQCVLLLEDRKPLHLLHNLSGGPCKKSQQHCI